MQYSVQKYFGRSPVIETLAGGIVVGLNELYKPVLRQCCEVGLAGKGAPEPTDGVLDATLLPGGVGITEEGFDTQIVETVVESELGAVVEGDGPPPIWGELSQDLGHSGGDGSGSLARWSKGNE